MGYYTDLWNKQKNTGTYQTRDGGTVKTTTAAQQAAQDYAKQQSTGNYKTTSGGTVKTTPKTSSGSSSSKSGGTKSTSPAADAYKALLSGNTSAKLTYTAPTVKAATPTKAETAIKAVEQYKDLAADAYKKKLAAAQNKQNEVAEEEEKEKAPLSTLPAAPAPAPKVQEPEVEEEFEEEEEALDPMEEYMQMILDAQNAQNAAQLQMLRNQSGVLNQQYDNNAAELYARYRRSGLMMPELMAGTATGIADSLTLQNDLNLQNNLAANELERAAAQNELNAQANQIQADADMQAAQTAAEWAKMAYQQRLANQNKGGNSNSGNNGNAGNQEVATEPVAMMSSAQAIVQARQASNTYTGQLAFLQQLLANGQITPAQYSDLKMALDPTLSYK